ncbi:MAG: hypothetical protein SFY70_07420 [Bacteroidia bacterium]|nr:hypothetical protein [Bacteroidia bacterium]
MATVTFERIVTKHEFDNHCIMLQDKAGNDYRHLIPGHKVQVNSCGKAYFAEVSEYYLNGKFLGGLHFDPKREDSDDFYYECGVVQGHHAKFTLEEGAALVGDKFPLSLELTIKTK